MGGRKRRQTADDTMQTCDAKL